MKKTIIIAPHNHFDLTWRRCFDRKARLGGAALASYAELEEIIINRWIALGQTFSEPQAALLEKYISRGDPPEERLAALRGLVSEGRLDIPSAGYTVGDSNLPAPEGLIRNFLVAEPIYNALGLPSRGLVWLEDVFGNSPNYPQIIRGVGGDTAGRLSYEQPEENVWVGIDGSKVAVFERFYRGFGVGGFEKQPYCQDCMGEGCAACGGTGIAFAAPLGIGAISGAIAAAAETLASDESLPFAAIEIGGEELLPEPELGEAIKRAAELYPELEIKLGTASDIYELVKPEIKKALESDRAVTRDLNPVFSGCYVSRIGLKQRVRRDTYSLLAAESGFAAEYWRAGNAGELPADIKQAWKYLMFCQFHDAVTGTHIDSAHAELCDMLDSVEHVINRYIKQPETGSESGDSSAQAAAVAPGTHEITLGGSKITFDDAGIIGITPADGSDRDKNVFGTLPYGRIRRPFRIAELCLEQDVGDAWATRVPPEFGPKNNWYRIPLGDSQRVSAISEDRVVWRGKYTGGDYMVRKLEWTVTLTAGENGLLKFETEIDWDTDSRRVKVLFPINSAADSALYEIPFGYIERRYDEGRLSWEKWSPDSREFAAQNFVLRTVGEKSGAAVLGRGIPCYRWLPGCLELSLLRSPQCVFCVNEPAHYDFNDTAGLRDAGRHVFEYALLPYYDGRSVTDITAAAHEYNQVDELILPFKVSGGAIVTAFKPSEDGGAFILRFYNPSDTDCDSEIDFGRTVSVVESDLLENPVVGVEVRMTDRYITRLSKFKIMTLRITI